jgi:DNA-binding response OmpR family regulator
MRTRRKRLQTILLLDDEEIERSSARRILQDRGCKILEADSFKNALALFKRKRQAVDLLIADISLPDGNGCELALTMQHDKPDLRVLFISGHVGAEVCRFYGLDVTDLHFLRKPFQPAELVNSVWRVFRGVPFPRIVPKTFTA